MPYLLFFWSGILRTYGHIWNQCPRICLFAKFRARIKMPNFGTKHALFGYFWPGILKNYCHIWNLHPQFVNNEFLTHAVNLSTGSTFSKSPVPDLVPLYKACRFSKNEKSLHLYEYHFQLNSSSFEKNSEKPPELTRHHDHRSWSMTARHTIA